MLTIIGGWNRELKEASQQPSCWDLIKGPFLWSSVLAPFVSLRDWSALSTWLIAPYLAWVSFAALINARTVQPDRRFGTAIS